MLYLSQLFLMMLFLSFQYAKVGHMTQTMHHNASKFLKVRWKSQSSRKYNMIWYANCYGPSYCCTYQIFESEKFWIWYSSRAWVTSYPIKQQIKKQIKTRKILSKKCKSFQYQAVVHGPIYTTDIWFCPQNFLVMTKIFLNKSNNSRRNRLLSQTNIHHFMQQDQANINLDSFCKSS